MTRVTPPYGTDGCRCTSEEGDHGHRIWYPMAHCPRHGVLASYTPPRMDTGTYRVVDLDLSSGRIVEHDFDEIDEKEAAEEESEAEYLRTRPGSPERARRDAERAPYDPGAMIDGPPVDSEAERLVRNLQFGGLTEAAAVELRDRYDIERGCPVHCRANPMDCPGPAEDGTCLAPTTAKERGVLATVRRWARRFGDWLDPYAALEREWIRQRRSGLDGGEPGPPGQQPRER